MFERNSKQIEFAVIDYHQIFLFIRCDRFLGDDPNWRVRWRLAGSGYSTAEKFVYFLLDFSFSGHWIRIRSGIYGRVQRVIWKDFLKVLLIYLIPLHLNVCEVESFEHLYKINVFKPMRGSATDLKMTRRTMDFAMA